MAISNSKLKTAVMLMPTAAAFNHIQGSPEVHQLRSEFLFWLVAVNITDSRTARAAVAGLFQPRC